MIAEGRYDLPSGNHATGLLTGGTESAAEGKYAPPEEDFPSDGRRSDGQEKKTLKKKYLPVIDFIDISFG